MPRRFMALRHTRVNLPRIPLKNWERPRLHPQAPSSLLGLPPSAFLRHVQHLTLPATVTNMPRCWAILLGTTLTAVIRITALPSHTSAHTWPTRQLQKARIWG